MVLRKVGSTLEDDHMHILFRFNELPEHELDKTGRRIDLILKQAHDESEPSIAYNLGVQLRGSYNNRLRVMATGATISPKSSQAPYSGRLVVL